MVLTGAHRRPPVLITMTARMGRLSWVYDGISYATTLKHVGVLQQTLYLVATMLGLAPCALAMGDSELATAAFGLDWPAEVSVGEFVVGLPATTPVAPRHSTRDGRVRELEAHVDRRGYRGKTRARLKTSDHETVRGTDGVVERANGQARRDSRE